MLIGHAGHEEVVGTTGQAPSAHGRSCRTSRRRAPSTIADRAAADLPHADDAVGRRDERDRARPPRAVPAPPGPPREDICYATQNRQDAVKELASRAGRGAGDRVATTPRTPSASPRSRASAGRPPTSSTTRPRSIPLGRRADVVGVTSGASAPEWLVERMLAWLASLGARRGGGDPASRRSICGSRTCASARPTEAAVRPRQLQAENASRSSSVGNTGTATSVFVERDARDRRGSARGRPGLLRPRPPAPRRGCRPRQRSARRPAAPPSRRAPRRCAWSRPGSVRMRTKQRLPDALERERRAEPAAGESHHVGRDDRAWSCVRSTPSIRWMNRRTSVAMPIDVRPVDRGEHVPVADRP